MREIFECKWSKIKVEKVNLITLLTFTLNKVDYTFPLLLLLMFKHKECTIWWEIFLGTNLIWTPLGSGILENED